MVTINLDPEKEKQLRKLARAQGEDASALLRRVVEDFLDLTSLPYDTADQWAESSAAMAAEVFEDEDWPEDDPDGSR